MPKLKLDSGNELYFKAIKDYSNEIAIVVANSKRDFEEHNYWYIGFISKDGKLNICNGLHGLKCNLNEGLQYNENGAIKLNL